MEKKAISAIVSSVFLVSLVIIIAAIVFTWIIGMTGKTIVLQGKNIQLVCEDVEFNADYSNQIIYMSNTGNVLIHDIKMKILKKGSYETKSFNELSSGWPESGLGVGDTFSGHIVFDSATEEIIIIPVLLGYTEDAAEEEYVCSEKDGFEIILG